MTGRSAFVNWLCRYRAQYLGTQVGAGVELAPSVQVLGPKGISLGDRTQIRRNSTIEAHPDRAGSIQVGADCRIKENVWLASYGGKILIGDNVLIGRNTVLHGHGGIAIGSMSMLGPNVTILTAKHGHDVGHNAPPFQLQNESSEPVQIGRNVWLGTDTTVVGGVNICPDVVVAAGAVVVASISEPGIYAGVPAKLVRSID